MYRGASIFYFNAPFFCFLFFNPQVRTNKMTNSDKHLLPLSFKISLKDTSCHIFLNSLGFYFSRECLLNFLELAYSTACGEIFKFLVFTFLRNALNLCIFTQVPVPHLKIQAHKIWRWLGTLGYLYFDWYIIFLNVMALQFHK